MSRYGIFLLACSLLLTISLQSGSTHAFSSKNFQQQGAASAAASTISSRKTLIFSTPPENEGEEQWDAFADPLASNKPPPAVAPTPEGTSYPIDLPSPILLASSMVLAIIGVGSGFDIFADEPRFPFAINATVSAAGLALCLGLFYASVLKAQAETEEDDRKYMSGR